MTNTSYRPLLYSLRTDPAENIAFILGEACLPSRFLAIEVYSYDVYHLENTSTELLTARVCWTVYRAVVWQRSNQIRYVMYNYNFILSFVFGVNPGLALQENLSSTVYTCLQITNTSAGTLHGL
jgi:hypothetical protein